METVLDARASKMFERIPSVPRRRLLEWAVRLEADPFLGDQIVKERIPSGLSRCRNLWRLALPDGWRALYTVVGFEENKTQAVVVWIGSHMEYDRLLGYS